MGVVGTRCFSLHHVLPVAALFGLGVQVVVQHLFVAIQTHTANRSGKLANRERADP